MSDESYIREVGQQLDLFKQTSSTQYNFRCPLCGDSEKSKFKKRGWFYQANDGMWMFHCFNCSIPLPFWLFLKKNFPQIYSRYIYETFSATSKYSKSEKRPKDDQTETIKKFLIPVNQSEKVQDYLRGRKIPEQHWNEIFIVKDFSAFKCLQKYKDAELPAEPRIVIPVYSKTGFIEFLISRAILPSSKRRYLNIGLGEDSHFFGLYNPDGSYKINLNKKIYVLEGAFDSMFLDNAIAVNSSDLIKTINHFGSLSEALDLVFIPDADRRNKEILRVYRQIIDSGHKICILPDSLEGKDLNEMVLKNNDINIQETVDHNLYQGLEALLKFNNWKKI